MNDKNSFDNMSANMLYAYRYLLNREPENLNYVLNNDKSWEQLRNLFMQSSEYKMLMELQHETKSYQKDVFTASKMLKEEYERTQQYPDYEMILQRNYEKLIDNADLVVDIGAHVGRHLRNFIELVGGKGRCIAFEPLPKQFKILKESFDIKNVEIKNIALSEEKGMMEFCEVENYPEESGLKKRIYNREDAKVKKIIVEVDMLDSYIDKMDKLNYIKLDAEGAEINILKGGIKTIQKYRPFISVEYGGSCYGAYGHTKQSLFNLAKELNYYITDIFGNLMPNSGAWEELCDSGYWDYFLVPQERLKEFYLRVHA